MALVKAGWWQTTWWPSQWWHEDWWLEYGTAAPPAPAFVHGGGRTITWSPVRTEQRLTVPEKPMVEVIPQPLPVGMTFEELVAYAREMLSVPHVTEEELRRVLQPLIPEQTDDDMVIEEALRGLLVGFKSDKELVEEGLRKILKENN